MLALVLFAPAVVLNFFKCHKQQKQSGIFSQQTFCRVIEKKSCEIGF